MAFDKERNWQNFWSRYKTGSRDTCAGWVGRFVSYGSGGSSPEDVRFQDVWLRSFKEYEGEGPEGQGSVRMQMIRKADPSPEAKSWPRAGRSRRDGNDETVLTGDKADSNLSDGFWHPYGRGAVPEARVVTFDADNIVNVTLRLPDADTLAASGAWDFVAAYEFTTIHAGTRHTLALSHRGADGGVIMFHQHSWDPIFVAATNPEEASYDFDELLHGQVPGPQLPADTSQWPVDSNWEGTSVSLAHDPDGCTWRRTSEEHVSWSPPVMQGNATLYRYPAGAYAVYPSNIADAGITYQAEMGVLLNDTLLRRLLVKYGPDLVVDSLTLQTFEKA